MNNLLKKVSGGLKIISRKLFKIRSPFEINIHITDKCNLRCTYCYSNFYKRKTKDISKENIFRIVKEFKSLGAFEVSLIGGEPFLHPDFSEIVHFVKDQNMFCSTVTNGYFIDKHQEAVKRLDMVCISIDGPEKINDITRGKGSFAYAIQALRKLEELGVNRSIRATLQKNNLNNIDDIVALAEKHEVMVNFGLLFPQSTDDGMDKTNSKDTPDDLEYKNAIKKIIKIKSNKKKLFFNSNTNFKNALSWPISYKKFFLNKDELKDYPNYSHIPCYGGRAFATIDTDGKLFPCTNLIGYYNAPNVLKMDIKKAWESIGNHDCAACFYLSSVEKNLVSNLNIDALLNLIKVKRL